MGTTAKFLLFGFLLVMVVVILATWGSIGSGILTLALLIALGYLALQRFMQTHDPQDFDWEG